MSTAAPVWASFSSLLPRRPYCTDDPRSGLRIRSRKLAINYRHVQYNDPLSTRWLMFDIDHDDAFDRWSDADLPAPSVVVQNRSNGRAHVAWNLATPVFGPAANGRSGPLAYLAAIEHGMCIRLGADSGYAGLVAKNPLHADYRVSWLAARGYGLSELAERLDPGELRRPRQIGDAAGLGRNCELFERTRKWAYSSVLTAKQCGVSEGAWLQQVLRVVEQANQLFSMPLHRSEVRGIAKSIAKWTWRRFNHDALSAIQSERGRRSGEVRRKGSVAEAQPWIELGISRATYYRRLRRLRAII